MIPKFVVTLALMAVQTAMTMSQKVRGPRLDSLKTTTADYGTPIPRFWGRRKFEGPVIWAADLIETQHTSKTMGGKNTQYKYFADFAVLICDHPIDAITKVWMDDKLVYQATDKGPVSMAAAVGITGGGTMRVYLGSETQTPDPLMEAWTDDKYGANSCPAYRGSSYVVFDRLPVNNFGNRIPNVTIEAVSAKTTVYLSDTVAKPGNLSGKQFSPALDRLYFIAGSGFQAIDVATKQLLVSSTISPGVGVGWPYAFTDSGIIAMNGSDMVAIGFDGGSAALGVSGVAGWQGCSLAGGSILLYPGVTIGNYVGVFTTTIAAVPVNHMATHYFTNAAGVSVAVGTTSGNILSIACPATSPATLIDTTAYGSSGAAYGFDNGTNYVVRQGSVLYLIDKSSFAIVGHVTDSGPGGLFESFDSIKEGATTFWNGLTEYNSSDLSIKRSVSAASWTVTMPGGGFEVVGYLYDVVDNALLSVYNGSGTTQGIVVRYLDRIASNGVTLQTVVDTVAGWCGLTGQDTSALTQTVLGYSVSQGTGKDMIGPLLDIHDVDARPHDFIVQFVNRGSAPSGAILTEDFVRGTGDRYTVTIQQDTDLARKLTFNFADLAHEQQPNNAIAQRPFDAVDTTREETVDLSTWADTVAGAQQKADRYLRRLWMGRESVKNALTAQHMVLEPADVTALSLDGVVQNVKLNKLTIGKDGLQCEWVRDETGVASLNAAVAGSPADSLTTQTITIPGQSRGFILDAPLVRDADNDVNPRLYYAAGSYGGSWPGAAVMEGSGGDYATLFGSIDSTHGATWGLASTALPTANPNLWDRGNSLSVSVYGTLTSHTEAEINADTALNLIALGDVGRWEYLQFATATLTGTSGTANLYTLTGFKRGRRGTEGNVGNHTASDQLLVLSGAVAATVGMDNVGEALTFKVQTLGRDASSAPAINVPFAGDTLKPYAPAAVKWAWDGTNLTGTITRRTRVGGNWSSAAGTIALGETSEAYEVDIYNGVTFKRTIALSGTNVFTYTAAMAAADGITLPTPPSIKAYQLSSAVGRGFALAA